MIPFQSLVDHSQRSNKLSNAARPAAVAPPDRRRLEPFGKSSRDGGSKRHGRGYLIANGIFTVRPEPRAVTFLDPTHPLRHTGPVPSLMARFGRVALAAERRRAGDEDGARKALGNDPMMPPALLAGASLEHLARITFG